MKENSLTLEKAGSSRYLARTITDADYADYIALLANTPAQAESPLHSLEWAAGAIGLHVNADKTEYMCFNRSGYISSLSGDSLKLVENFTYLGSSVSSTENGINTRLLIGYRSYGSQTYPIKYNTVFSKQQSCPYYCMDAQLKRWLNVLRKSLTAIAPGYYELNKSWKQHPTKQQLYGHLSLISKTIQIRWTILAGHCWRCKVELLSNVLLLTPSRGCTSVGRSAWTYLQQLCLDTRRRLEDSSEAMVDRDGWREGES